MKILEFIKKHKFEITIGTGFLLVFCQSLRYYKKLDEVNKLINDFKEDTDRILTESESMIWPIPGIDPNTSISKIAGISRWGSAFKGYGIYTLGDLVRYIRDNGVNSIENIPGIGESGVSCVIYTLRSISNRLFRKLYV